MITKEEALLRLKKYWRVEKLQFTATYKKNEIQEGKSESGYFQPYTENFSQLRYPTDSSFTFKRLVSLYSSHREDLKDGETYVVEMELQDDKYRQKYQNPFLLKLNHFKKLEIECNTLIDKDEVKSTIKQVNEEYLSLNSPFQVINQANSVNLLATDIYSENKRFVYELIQNADDAAIGVKTEVEIRITKNYIVIGHKGKPFTGRDIRGLCGVGLGSKTNDETKTGYKGIGFKSVFGQPAGLVFVQSDQVLFKFDKKFIEEKTWKKEWGDQKKWEKENNAKFKSPWQLMPILINQTSDSEVDAILQNNDFTVRTIIKVNNSKQMRIDLKDMLSDAHVLLFLRKVEKINLFEGNQRIISIKKDIEQKKVRLYLNNQLKNSYYLYKRTIDVDPLIQELLQADIHTPDKIRNMKRLEFAIAVCLNDENSKIKLLEKQQSPIYSYLPTSDLDYEFPFLVNGNFILDAGRQKISKDHNWNAWLFKVIGTQTVELCSELAKNKLHLDNYFELLFKGKYSQTGLLFQNYNKGLELGLKQIPFILNKDNDLIRLDQVCIDDLDLLKNNICSAEIIVQILHNKFSKQIATSNVFGDSLLIKILKKLGGFSLSHKKEFIKELVFSNSFANNISIQNNALILDFLRNLEESDASKKWYIDIRNHQFILNSESQLCSIVEVCYPENAIDEDPEFENSLIHSNVYDHILTIPELKLWLDNIGVKAPGSISFLEKEIISKFPDSINTSSYLKYTNFIMDLHYNSKLTEEHYFNLQALPLLTEAGFICANKCILNDFYLTDFDFKNFKKAQNFVDNSYGIDSTYSKLEWKEFFIKINVTNDIDFIENLVLNYSELPSQYTSESFLFAKNGHSYKHLVGVDYVRGGKPIFFIQHFSMMESVDNIDEWTLFWNYLFKKYKLNYIGETIEKINYSSLEFKRESYRINSKLILSSLAKMTWGRQKSNRVFLENYFHWKIKNNPIIPTKYGLKIASEVYLNSLKNKELIGDYFPIVDLDTEIPKGWSQLLGLRQELSNEAIFDLLTKVTSDLYLDKKFKKENIRRIGLIYNLIISRLLRFEDKREIESLAKNWINNNNLPAINLSLFSPSDLIYVKIENIEINEGNQLSILIPKNVNKADNNLEELFQLFEIKVIDDVIYEEDNSIENLQVKINALKLLPFITFQKVNNLVIKNIENYMNEMVNKLKVTYFYDCDSIKGYFEIDGQKLLGPELKFSYDFKRNSVFSTDSYFSAKFRLDYSSILVKIYDASKVSKEVLFGLGLSESERFELIREEVMKSNIDFDSILYHQAYLDLLNELENELKSKKVTPLITDINPVEIETDLSQGSEKEIVLEEGNISSFKSDYFEYEKELSEFNDFFDLDLAVTDKADWNAVAIFKAIKYYEAKGFSIDHLTEKAKTILREKYFEIYSDDTIFKIYPRSARQNLLFVSIQLWESLADENVEIFVLTGDSKHKVIASKEDLLDGDKNLLFKIKGENVEDRVDIVNRILEDNVNNLKFDEEGNIVFVIRINTFESKYSSLFDEFDY